MRLIDVDAIDWEEVFKIASESGTYEGVMYACKRCVEHQPTVNLQNASAKRIVIGFHGAPEFHLKKPILWVKHDSNVMTKVASFNNLDAANLFSAALAEQLHIAMLKGESEDDSQGTI